MASFVSLIEDEQSLGVDLKLLDKVQPVCFPEGLFLVNIWQKR